MGGRFRVQNRSIVLGPIWLGFSEPINYANRISSDNPFTGAADGVSTSSTRREDEIGAALAEERTLSGRIVVTGRSGRSGGESLTSSE